MRTLVLIAFSCFVSCSAAWAQLSTAQIHGAVQDASGAAVPGAAIKVTQTDTGVSRSAVSGPDGGYVLPDLPVGPYRLEISKEGFARYVQTGIILQVAGSPSIDIALKVGGVTEQIKVEANATMVETQSSGVGQVTDSQRVVELPLIGRNITDLITLAGGATTGADGALNSSRNYNTQSYSVAGGLASSMGYVLDGAMHNDPYTNLNLPLPFPDAMQEFKIETSALPAQYGLHSAAVINAVTKSGNNEFHGDGFEFVRNYLFNARNFFATSRDSLKRNQFGGTFGGPIRKNKLFFFLAFQDTLNRQNSVTNTTFIPTAAMLAGDFTTYASTVCQPKAVTLKAPFVNNQIAPSMLSVPALNIAAKLPTTADPCGKIVYGAPNDSNDRQGVAKFDYQINQQHSMFARYLAVSYGAPIPYNLSGGNLLTTASTSPSYGQDILIQSFVLGDTYLVSSSVVNSFRATLNRSGNHRLGAQFFGPQDVGIDIFSYLPKFTSISVTGAFGIGTTTSSNSYYSTTTYQFGDDVGVVRGNHQMAFGANVAHWISDTFANVYAMGPMTFSGQTTGLALADFLLGDVATFQQSSPNVLYMRETYLGAYAQDSWKVTPKLSFSYGLRWEPYFPQLYPGQGIYHFDLNAFNAGIRTTKFTNAPAGLSYPGDPGFPTNAGMTTKWGQFAPRVGLVWDPKGDGRMSVRASFGEFYDVLTAQFNLNGAVAPPWGARTTLSGVSMANPYAGQTNPFPSVIGPNAVYPNFGSFQNFPYDFQPTQVQEWNFTVQRQLGTDWLLSAAYLGNHIIHMLGSYAINPPVFMGLGACTLNGVSYPVCSTTTNENQRRVLYLQNPAQGILYGDMDQIDSGGTGSYNGLLVSVQRRLNRGVTAAANYTWSHCIADPSWEGMAGNSGQDYTHVSPPDREADRGNCDLSGSDRRQIFNLNLVAQTPNFASRWMTILASGWRASGILSIQTGAALLLSTGQDNALDGIMATYQRPNLVLSNPYGNGTPGDYLNPAAFALPAPGTYGNLGAGAVHGPGFVSLNVGLSRVFRVHERQTLELRAEANNVLNHFNPGNPVLTVSSANFGQITATTAGAGIGFVSPGDPRIMQFAIKYLF